LDGSRTTPLRWAGSKKRILSRLLELFPEKVDSYCEPFCGSACLYFALRPNSAVLGDLNSSLIEFYTEIIKNPERVWQIFRNQPRSREAFNRSRECLRSEPDPTTRAALFYFVNRNCFNGLYRTNREGQFNVPFSDSRVAKYPDLKEFLGSADELRKALFVNADFEITCRDHAQGCDFFYLDPPYFSAGQRIFREYDAKCFGPGDFPRLVNLLKDLDRGGKQFLLSFPDSDLALGSFAEWSIEKIAVRRTVSADVGARKMATEITVRNY
jgi:DNA adenine methylase